MFIVNYLQVSYYTKVDKSLSGKKEKMKNVRVPAVFIQRSIFLEMIEKGKTLHEIRLEIGKVLTGKPPCNKTLSSWRKKYLNKTFSINDKRKGRTNVCPTKYRKLGQAFVKSGCRSARQFSKVTGIPRSSVTYALHKAGMHYGNATQVPKILDAMQRNKRVEYCKTMLSILENAERRDFRNIITLDETPLYFDNTSKLGWFSNGKNRPEVERASLKKKKVTLTVAWGVDGAVLVKCCSGENRINTDYFCKTTISGIEEWARKKDKVAGISAYLIHMDNAPCHNSVCTKEYMARYSIERMPHPPYSPDLSPCDFHLFGYMKSEFADAKFKSLSDIEERITAWINEIPESVRISTFQNWMKRVRMCIKVDGEYVDKYM